METILLVVSLAGLGLGVFALWREGRGRKWCKRCETYHACLFLMVSLMLSACRSMPDKKTEDDMRTVLETPLCDQSNCGKAAQ